MNHLTTSDRPAALRAPGASPPSGASPGVSSRSSVGFSAPFSGGFEAPPLGIYAESSSPIVNQSLSVDPETGEIRREGWDYEAALVERYALQSQARRAMLESWRKDGKEGRAHKVTRCRRWLRPRGRGLPIYAEVHGHQETGRAFFSGVEVCASPWACPVCSAKIQERRSEEIRLAVEQWAAEGGICLFVTLTVPHGVDDALAPMLGRFRAALERFRSGKRFAAINSGMGRVGLIRAFETTWGEVNGWHPHTHELWFVRPDDLRAWALSAGFEVQEGRELSMSVCQYAAKEALYDLWWAAALSAGLPEPSQAHGLDLRVAATQEEMRAALADYLAKLGRDMPEGGRPLWGPAEELARAHSKKGRGFRRMSPFDFLRAQFDQELSVAQRIRFRELFAEYVQAFKGVAQIFWSRGLKARFGLAEKSDEETAEESREAADTLARLEPEQWERLFFRADHRATVLILAQEGGGPLVCEFVAGLPPPPVSDTS